MFNPVEELKELVSASANVFCRLGALGVKKTAKAIHEGHQPREERQFPQILCSLKVIPKK